MCDFRGGGDNCWARRHAVSSLNRIEEALSCNGVAEYSSSRWIPILEGQLWPPNITPLISLTKPALKHPRAMTSNSPARPSSLTGTKLLTSEPRPLLLTDDIG